MVWIWMQILGSIPLTNGSRCRYKRPKNIWMLQIRIRSTGTFTSFFKDKSHKKSKSIRNLDADPGGPKTYGSGSATLFSTINNWNFKWKCPTQLILESDLELYPNQGLDPEPEGLER
jgi:hypothetical protein